VLSTGSLWVYQHHKPIARHMWERWVSLRTGVVNRANNYSRQRWLLLDYWFVASWLSKTALPADSSISIWWFEVGCVCNWLSKLPAATSEFTAYSDSGTVSSSRPALTSALMFSGASPVRSVMRRPAETSRSAVWTSPRFRLALPALSCASSWSAEPLMLASPAPISTPRCSKSQSATSRPAASSKSTLRLPSLSSGGNWSVTCCLSGAQLIKHQPSQRFGACTTSWSSLRSKRHFSALTPSVCSVASLTSANSRLNCDALASTSRSVMPVVSAVIVEVPRVKLTAEENPVVTATTSKMRPPSTAMSTMMGLAAGERGGCGSGVGVGLCEV